MQMPHLRTIFATAIAAVAASATIPARTTTFIVTSTISNSNTTQ